MVQKTQISFWGVRGSYPVPDKAMQKIGGNTACVALHHKKQWIVFDSGTGIIPLGQKLFKNREAIWIAWTHLHWDHVLGLPFFAPLQEKGRKIALIGSQKKMNRILHQPFFPVTLGMFPAKLAWRSIGSDWSRIGDIWIHAFPVQHTSPTVGYHLILPSGARVVHVADGELSLQDRHFLSRIGGVDLLIHDAQFSRDEYVTRKGWGHSCFLDVVEAAVQADVKRLFLFHHSPKASDQELARRLRQAQALIRRKKSRLICDLAQEGKAVSI